VNIDQEFNERFYDCLAEKSVRIRRELHPVLKTFLYVDGKCVDFPFFGQKHIFIFTEYKRNGITYRAHPNYKSFGEWYDWAMVKFEAARGQKDFPFNSKGGFYAINLFPCKIICFLQSEENQSIQAVLQCCNASEHNEDGILVESWKKEHDVDEVMNVLVSN